MNEMKRKLISAAAGALAGAAVVILLLLLVSALLLKNISAGDPALTAAGLVCAAAGAFAGGYLAARLSRSAGLIVGAVSGAVTFLIIMAVNIPLGNIPQPVSIMRAMIMLTAGAVGGVTGVGGKRKRGQRRRK